MEPLWRTPGDGIRESLNKKAGRYGELDAPYIVAVNATGDYHGEDDAVDAAFGSECVVITQHPDGTFSERMDRNPDGVWWGNAGPRNTGLSAVLSAERLSPWSIGQRRARLIRSPYTSAPLPPVALGVDELNPEDGRLVKSAGASFADIFGLPDGWPEDPNP